MSQTCIYMYIRIQKQRDTDWLRSSAQAMELELDQDWYGTETTPTTINTREANGVQSLKGTQSYQGLQLVNSCHGVCSAELETLLQVPVIPRSVSVAYPTCDEDHKLLEGLKGSCYQITPKISCDMALLLFLGATKAARRCGQIVTTETRDALMIAKTKSLQQQKKCKRKKN